MTNFRMALLELLRKDGQGADPQFLRDGVRLLAQELMDAEVTEAIGAAPYERTNKRVTSREPLSSVEGDGWVNWSGLATFMNEVGELAPVALRLLRAAVSS